jgi:hypothetical protein
LFSTLQSVTSPSVCQLYTSKDRTFFRKKEEDLVSAQNRAIFLSDAGDKT